MAAEAPEIPGYVVDAPIGGGATSVVYRCTAGGGTFAVKVMRELIGGLDISLRFRKEASAIARLHHPSIVGVVEAGEHRGSSFLVMEYVQGEELALSLARERPSEQAVLSLAKALASALAEVHRHGLIHRDIKPTNIIMCPDGTPKLIDFGFVGATDAGPTTEVVGTLVYCPPEQSGALKRRVDSRADLYALGAVLYECLTGVPPYGGQTVADLLHQHAAFPVPRVADKVPEVRPVVAAIVEKLLAKDPDDRYQTAQGLLADLEALQELESHQRTTGVFALASRDVALRGAGQEIPLVGRTAQVQLLTDAWRAVAGGKGTVIQIEGEGGSGKTRLVREVVRSARESGALILSGKAQQGDATPLGPLREAIDDHLNRIRRASAPEQEAALAAVKRAAGEYGAVIRRLSRGLAAVFSDAPALGRSTNAHEDQEMFFSRIAEFIVGLAKESKGLLFQLDDTQWLDTGSLEVLRRVGRKLSETPLLLATTARNDPDSREAAARFIDELGAESAERCALEPLTRAEVGELVAAHLGHLDLEPKLVELLANRANGNPFAVGQYVRSLLDSGALRPAHGKWLVDETRWSDVSLPEDVFQLIVNRIATLDVATMNVLNVAAAIGMKFQVGLLSRASQSQGAAVERALEEGLRAQVIEAVDATANVYGFVHDRLVEALVRHIPAETLRDIHQAIADAMRAEPDPSPEAIEALARHAWAGRREENAKSVYDTSLAAGLLSLQNYSNEQAVELLKRAQSVSETATLDAGSRQQLFEALAEACTRTGRMTEGRALLERALSGARDANDRARVCYLVAETLFNSGKAMECWKYCEDALKALDAPLPRSTPLRRVYMFWYWVLALLLTATGLRFGSARGATRSRYELLHKIFELQAQMALMLGDVELFTWLTVHKVVLGHFIGASREYSSGHAWYSYYTGNMGLAEPTVHHGELAVTNGQQLGDRFAEWHAREFYTFGLEMLGAESVYPTERIQLEMFPHMLRWCDPWDVASALCGHVFTHTMRGHSRTAVEFALNHWSSAEQSDSANETERNRSRLMLSVALSCVQAHLHFLGRTQEAAMYALKLRQLLGESGVATWAYSFVYYSQVQGLLEQGIYGKQLDEAMQGFLQTVYEKRFEESWNRFGYVVVAEARLERLTVANPADRAAERRELSRALHMAQSRAWTPVVRAYFLAVKAGVMRLDGKLSEALKYAEEAERYAEIADSPAARFLIAKERARVAVLRKATVEAGVHAKTALEIAHSMGWTPRAQRIRKEFGEFIVNETSPKPQSIVAASTAASMSITRSTFADMSRARFADAILKVSLATASTLDPAAQARLALDALVKVLSAERAFLFLYGPTGSLDMSAGRDVSGADLTVLKGYSTTVVKKVSESREALVVTGTEEGEAIGSASAVAYDLRSIMAAPLIFQERVLGVVYLDSTLAKGLFTTADVEVLLAIANHIAIALETARAARVEAERQVLAKDLELTASVQTLFLPQSLSHQLDRVELEGLYRPATLCSGDWWWVYEAEGTLRLLVGDVTGHGAPSAMITAAVASTFHVARKHALSQDLPSLLKLLSESLGDITHGRFRMTMTAVEVDSKQGELRYWNAGAPPILLMNEQGQVKPLTIAGTPLGGTNFTLGTMNKTLAPRERLMIYTDGMSELVTSTGKPLGLKRMVKTFQDTRALGLAQAKTAIERSVDDARGTVPLEDDVTVAVVELVR